MKQKALISLLIVAFSLGLIAYVVTKNRNEPPRTGTEKLFADLDAKVNDAAAIEVVTKDKSITIAKLPDAPKGEEWAVTSSGNFPADFEKVKPLLVQLSNAAIVEAKTSKPENYQMIGVEEPTRPGSGSTMISVKDSKGATLASVIIGETAGSTPGPMSRAPGGIQRFVRRAGEAQSYLAKDVPAADANLLSWIKPEIMRIESTRMKAVTITHPPADDAPGEVIELIKIEEPNFTLKAMPPGRELKYPGIASGVAGALGYINLEDVIPASTIDPSLPATVTEYQTKDGLVITARTVDKDGKPWTIFSARVTPVEAAPTPAPPTADPASPASESPPLQPATPDPKIAAEAEELNRRLAPWAFSLSTYTVGQLRSKLSDLLKETTPAPTMPDAPVGPIAPQPAPPPNDSPGMLMPDPDPDPNTDPNPDTQPK